MSRVFKKFDANAIVIYNSSSHCSNEEPNPLCEASVRSMEFPFMLIIMVVFCNF